MYQSPTSAIRKWDEEHGITLKRNEMTGQPVFEANREMFMAENTTNIFPEYFRSRTLDRFSLVAYSDKNQAVAKTAYAMSINFVKQYDRIIKEAHGGGLYFYSKTKGSGKTFLSTIIGNELTNLGHQVRWFATPSWLQELRESYDRESGTSTAQVLNQARNAEVLILDDIGVEKQTPWVNETIYTLLDYRMSTCKPTIFTSNHLPEELSYDERIVDRITRMTELIRLPEENVRRRLASSSRLSSILKPWEGK